MHIDLAAKVEAIARKIDGELDVEYVYYPEVNALGAQYIGAADFLVAGQDEHWLRVHVTGRDCLECKDDAEFERLIRARIAAALDKAGAA